MFERSVDFYDAIYRFKDYASEADEVRDLVKAHLPSAKTILDVACGTGRHLELLRRGYEVEGLDVSARMLAVAAARLPDVALHLADMASFDLGRTYDVVACLFRSIAYARSRDRMVEAVASMARHVRRGGLLLLDPWFSPETYWVGHVAANFAQTETAKISWMYTQARHGDVGVLDIHYLVGTAEGVEHFTERHEMGLFTHAQYRDALTAAGLHIVHDPGDVVGEGPFVARKPADGS